MARICNVNIPDRKNVFIALTYVKGVGVSLSKKVLQELKIDLYLKANKLTDQQINLINQELKKFTTEGELVRKVNEDIKNKININCYQGIRHSMNAKVRGQSTRHCNRTRPKGIKNRQVVANKKKAPKQG